MLLLKTITINGHQAIVNYDPDIKMYRLKKEAAISLRVLFEIIDEYDLHPVETSKFEVSLGTSCVMTPTKTVGISCF
jgi:hypothetical protein